MMVNSLENYIIQDVQIISPRSKTRKHYSLEKEVYKRNFSQSKECADENISIVKAASWSQNNANLIFFGYTLFFFCYLRLDSTP